MLSQTNLFRITIGPLARPTLVIQNRKIYREKLDHTLLKAKSKDLLEDPVWSKVKVLNKVKTKSSLKQLDSLLSGMKTVQKKSKNFKYFASFGNSDFFNYATNRKFDQSQLRQLDLQVWNKLNEDEMKLSYIRLPLNGFEEMIQLTEEGKLWKFPIDNEQGLDAEHQVPFEEHVFLEDLIDGRFPKNDFIREFMVNITTGLARNHWITAQRKRDIITFYAEYFAERCDLYSKSGVDLEYPDPPISGTTPRDTEGQAKTNAEASL